MSLLVPRQIDVLDICMGSKLFNDVAYRFRYHLIGLSNLPC